LQLVKLHPCHVVAGIALALALPVAAAAQGANTIPTRLTDQEFWKMSVDFSEPDGFFRFENFLSNEATYQYVIPQLIATTKPGNVYFGVGPEQNFTYMADLKPKMAVIFDIRRGNLHVHLLYKALFEMSNDRAEFVSRLFSKPRPARLDTTTTIDSIWSAFWYVPTDSALYRRNLAAVKEHLVNKHSLPLSSADSAGIEYVYGVFYMAGPNLDYNYPNLGNGRSPTYADLTVLNDGRGVQRGFLATESRFRFIKDMETRNMIIPVVGDFGGPKAIRAAGKYVRDHGAIVSTIYTSNVEQYLFQSGDAWRRYYESVATLPLDSTSMFIRSIGSGGGGAFGGGGGAGFSPRLPSVLSSVQGLISLYNAGRIQYYEDVTQYSRRPSLLPQSLPRRDTPVPDRADSRSSASGSARAPQSLHPRAPVPR
jgi:hypothetical protein